MIDSIGLCRETGKKRFPLVVGFSTTNPT